MKEFFNNFRNSFYNPNYYKEILTKPFSYSFKYYALFTLVVSLLMAIVFSVVLLPKISPLLSNLELKVTRNFPQGLEVKIENGQASANVEQPYFIKTPQSLKGPGEMEEYSNIIVLDTENNFDLNKFYSYKTLLVLAKDSIAYYERDKLTIQSLKDVPNIVINKENLSFWIKSMQPFLKILYPSFFVIAFIGMLFYFVWQLFYLLFLSLIIWLIIKMKNVKAGYWKCYQIGMHLVTPLIVLFLLLGLLRLSFPFAFTLAVILLAVFNIKNEPRLDEKII